MSDGHRFVDLMRQVSQMPENERTDIVVGTVISISPLKINVEGRELSDSFLIVSPLCKLYVIYTEYETEHEHPTTDGAVATKVRHRHEIIMWRGIIPGDKVLMIKAGRGQKYYVLQRKDGLSNESKEGLK